MILFTPLTDAKKNFTFNTSTICLLPQGSTKSVSVFAKYRRLFYFSRLTLAKCVSFGADRLGWGRKSFKKRCGSGQFS